MNLSVQLPAERLPDITPDENRDQPPALPARLLSFPCLLQLLLIKTLLKYIVEGEKKWVG